MTILKLLLTLAIPILLGYGVIAMIAKKQTRLGFIERLALAWGSGMGLLGIGMFTLSLAGIKLTFFNAALPALAAILLLFAYLLANKIPVFNFRSLKEDVGGFFQIVKEPNPWRRFAQYALSALIGLTVIYVFFDALVKPILNFDDLWRQGCIAKIIFVTGRVLTEQARELAGPHPYLNPLSQAWIYLGIGAWNDALGKIVFALCFASLIVLFYAGIRKYAGRLHSLLFTYILTSFPLIVYHAGTAYSDLMQTFYYSVGIIYLYQWLESKNNFALSISALFLGIGVFVKQLGTPLWIIAAAVIFLYLILENKRQFKPFIQFSLLSILVSLPWLINRQSFLLNLFLPHTGGLAAAAAKPAAISPYGPPTFSGILEHMSRRMFLYADWQILWFVFFAALALFWQRIWQSKLKYLLLIILLNLVMMIYGFTEQNAYNFLVDGTLVQRMLMYQAPLALFIAAQLLLPKGKMFMPKVAKTNIKKH